MRCAREVEAGIADGRAHAVAALAHAGVGQADHGEDRQAERDVDFDRHREGLDAATAPRSAPEPARERSSPRRMPAPRIERIPRRSAPMRRGPATRNVRTASAYRASAAECARSCDGDALLGVGGARRVDAAGGRRCRSPSRAGRSRRAGSRCSRRGGGRSRRACRPCARGRPRASARSSRRVGRASATAAPPSASCRAGQQRRRRARAARAASGPGSTRGVGARGSWLRPGRRATRAAGARWSAATRPCAPCTTAARPPSSGAGRVVRLERPAPARADRHAQLVVALAHRRRPAPQLGIQRPDVVGRARRPTRRRAAGRPGRSASRRRWRPATRPARRSRTAPGCAR